MYFYLTIAALGSVLGRLAAGWAASMLHGFHCGGLLKCQECGAGVSSRRRWLSLVPVRCQCGNSSGWWPVFSALGLAIVYAGFTWLLVGFPNCQGVHEVRPNGHLESARLWFHLALIFLLWVTLITDLLDYVIPDEIIYIGIPLAVVAAFWSGELQIIHVWVNWDEAYVSLYGPYLPEWMKNHHHLHGLAWSLAGMITGMSVTWLVRAISGTILGQPALGFGDVTLMGLIGAFIGWQPTLCVLAIAPLVGIVIGLLVRITTGRSFVAYGPYLVCSAIIVLCTWRWLWADYFELRTIFSHWPTILGLLASVFAALIVLLGLLRLFRTVPAQSLRR